VIDLMSLVASGSAISFLDAVFSVMIVFIFDWQYSCAPARSKLKYVEDLAVSGSEIDPLVS
jgi:hypothetical protein